ncbi:hypothetical protein FZI85_07750 [Mycobacterium sp. CBMA293]|uniref:hypothetical protein n=1 Tax=unclassified Mycolicibacterium TaxID=2636767 RepID=UPI0012DE3A49|nr:MULTISPECIES: hypothetical protein [unclassified Mycolicibacterium]MUL46506.1 hypothetical protein [Mycolicibacterium sp. CBMA 360]MUL56982.1 hypothetical protein [Mycolicibacterium sp. CBMA 335]MUL70022.1 hypothetical protein [Mycolicibacterium sp. CBMA 311]MUL92070.1 hypothetical protein [Mycolicibacterium sp. CBMA 230]MUM05808.1 hypothetical protein [Mycolicibacterium sp. CBMA 213]
MDVETVDQQYATLQQQSQQTASLIQALAGKLSAAAAAGDTNAREWQLDLKEIALAIRDEESATGSVFQSIHALVANHVQSAEPQYQPPAPQYQPQYQPPAPQYQPQYQQPAYVEPQYQPQQSGGTLQRFLGGNFGQSIVRGAGFGIGDDIVNSIFDRL